MEGKKLKYCSLEVSDEREEEEWRSEVVKGCEEEGTGEWATDDLTGKSLNAEEVRETRMEEVGFMRSLGLFEEVEGPDVDEVD